MYVYFKLETEREKNICVYVHTLDIKKNFYNNSKYLFSKRFQNLSLKYYIIKYSAKFR